MQIGIANAFDIDTNAIVKGDLSVNMNCRQTMAPGEERYQENRYALDIMSIDGNTEMLNTFADETGQTNMAINSEANPSIGSNLSVKEKIGVGVINPDEMSLEVAGSNFEAQRISFSSTGDMEASAYNIEAEGAGAFEVGVAETVTTPDPLAGEKYIYQLKGNGTFSIEGNYGFCSAEQEEGDSFPLSIYKISSLPI
jgi:hypothetical protein